MQTSIFTHIAVGAISEMVETLNEGVTPKNMSANWRNFQHIKQDIDRL